MPSPDEHSATIISPHSRRSLRSLGGRSSTKNAATPATIDAICPAWPGIRKFS